MNISLPEAMRRFVEDEVIKGSYGSASEYFRELLRERQRARAQAVLETRLAATIRKDRYKDFSVAEFEQYMNKKAAKRPARKSK